jgi:hypothetical protein
MPGTFVIAASNLSRCSKGGPMPARSTLVAALGLAVGTLAASGLANAQGYGAPYGSRGSTCAENPINCAYNPGAQQPQVGVAVPGGTREISRLGGAPLPPELNAPLVRIQVGDLRDVAQRWVLTLNVKNQSLYPIDPMVSCLLSNGGRPVTELTHTAYMVRPGETVLVEFIGPPVTAAYVDRGICRVVGPLM